MPQLNTLSLALLIPTCISFILVCCLWRRRTVPGATTFLLLNLAMAVWSLAYGLELSSSHLSVIAMYYKLEYLGIPFIPVLFFILVLQYTGRNQCLKTRYILLMLLFPVLTLIINCTNEYHGLFYSAVELNLSGPVPMQVLTRGLWFWVHIAYSYSVMGAGILMIIWQLFHTTAIYRNQLIILLIGAVFSWIVNIICNLLPEIPFSPLDLTPFIFAFSCVIIAWGMFRYQLFDIAPIARDYVIERMKDGMIVLDERGRVIDCNPGARAIFNWKESPIGQFSYQVWQGWPEMLQAVHATHEEVIEGRPGDGNSIHYYNVTVSQLQSHNSKIKSCVIMLNDVTALKRAETELLTLSIHDSLTGLYNRLGFYRMAEQQLKASERAREKLLLIFIDLNDMKAINDIHGHLEGDNALKDTAKILSDTFRKSDIIARMGGDEFVVLAPCKNEIDAVVAVGRLHRSVAEYNTSTERMYLLSLSCGFSIYYPGDAAAINDLIRRADADMYEQKKSRSVFLADSSGVA